MDCNITEHVLMLPVSQDLFLLYQCLLRKGVLVDDETLTKLISGDDTESQVKFLDISCFSLCECLLDNPGGIKFDEKSELNTGTCSEFYGLLKKHGILTSDGSYVENLGKRTSLFDRDHIGNFHQQIGEFLFRSRGGNPEEWWIYQKFNRELTSPRNTPYLYVQERFFEEYFNCDYSGQKWLDFGCGIGYYSHLFAKHNAEVLGVDPSESYIEIAKRDFTCSGKNEYLKAKFESIDDFYVLSGKKFDRIFMSDVFLYYYEPYKEMELNADLLLVELEKLLAPGGVISILDPHGCFHLQPWLATKYPFLVSTEYRHRNYRVTPNLEEVSISAENAGLCISKIRELYNREDDSAENQPEAVTSEFPLWWYFELKRA
jgi:2-polyprenyl-3-methyl-5-hydroxy-6-metoxy-1,4-benzoquinol methylase